MHIITTGAVHVSFFICNQVINILENQYKKNIVFALPCILPIYITMSIIAEKSVSLTVNRFTIQNYLPVIHKRGGKGIFIAGLEIVLGRP